VSKFDTDLSARLDGIARVLEDFLSIDPGALGRDKETPARLYRIERALSAFIGFISNLGISLSTIIRPISFSIQDPENVKTNLARGTKSLGVYLNGTANNYKITRIYGISDSDNYSFTIFKSDSATDISTTSDVQVAVVLCDQNGVANFYGNVTTFDNDTLEPGKWLIWEHTAGTADVLSVIIEGHFE